jgi:O-antigen/teichoic acid export membrane protein
VATFVHTDLNKFIIGYFSGLEQVAFYEVAARVVSQLKAFPHLMLNPITPAASEIKAADQSEDRLQSLYYRSLKYMSLASLPVFGFVGVLAEPLVELWLGPGYEMAALSVRLLTAATFVNLLTAPGFFILVGIGKPLHGVYSSLLGIVLNVVLGVVLAALAGYVGAIVGTALALVIASTYFVFAFHGDQGIPLVATVSRAVGYPGLVAVVLSVLLSLLPASLLDGYWIASLAVAYGTIYLLIIVRSCYLDDYDLNQLHKFASRLGLFRNW